MGRERRKRTRVPLDFKVVVAMDNLEIPVHSRNISLKGLLCSPDSRFLPDKMCHVIFNLSPEVRAVIQGRVVRTNAKGTAIDFEEMDAESFSHLKKIVEYHTANPEKIAKEILVPAFSGE
ncbi:MAG: PilZ domain-containing protein [Thermodesulfobacteriota bacterium]